MDQSKQTKEEDKIGTALEKIIQSLNNLKKGNNHNSANSNNNNKGKGKMTWRKDAPEDDEPTKKTFEGTEYKWCGKYRGGRGLWTKESGKHSTDQHDLSKRKCE